MLFKPCIDLHDGKVKQIVGSTLNSNHLVENFISSKDSLYYSSLYKKDNLTGGHIIMLGDGNQHQAEMAIKNFQNSFQIGGGIRLENASYWLSIGAQKVILNSAIFENQKISKNFLSDFQKKIGKEKITIDLSCKKKNDDYFLSLNKWQTFSDIEVNENLFSFLAEYCSEFLIHAVDMEGKQSGIDKQLIHLIQKSPIPVVYAGGISSLEEIKYLHKKNIAYSIGSALDIFGGKHISYQELIEFEKNNL